MAMSARLYVFEGMELLPILSRCNCRGFTSRSRPFDNSMEMSEMES